MDSVHSESNQTMKYSSPIMPDALIEVSGYTFCMHKALLANNSLYLRRLIQEHYDEENDIFSSKLDIPGGAATFKVVAKYIYGQDLELTSSNIIPVLCAAYHLDMTDNYTRQSLISQAERFLFKEIFRCWKETLEALISCEDIFSHADEADLVSACLVSLAYKVKKQKSQCPDWWFEDVCSLNLHLFKKLVKILGAIRHDPANISNAVIYYANGYDLGSDPNSSGVWSQEKRKLLEEMVYLLPAQKGATSTKLLLDMLSSSIKLNASMECMEILEKRIGAQLEAGGLVMLLVTNSWDKCRQLGTGSLKRIIEHFVDEHYTLPVGRNSN
ncbi:BTB/POZ domain-containing protein [Rhynchospora pubera]|uniref:BTB/POZ domain-containing protein n=1 Tax=Rhynchospora pubera TaxID=906938 RepID=A0AAV8H5W6_9POAL|nr:BTB/POZ domain-containing protein [Rhynchospora pubera]